MPLNIGGLYFDRNIVGMRVVTSSSPRSVHTQALVRVEKR